MRGAVKLQTMKAQQITFTTISKSGMKQLWSQGAHQTGWPNDLQTAETFAAFIQAGQGYRELHEGEVTGIYIKGVIAGFTSLHRIESCFTDTFDDCLYEGGTYLLPNWRGQGINKWIKQYLVQTAFTTYHGTWCVFCIPTQNTTALIGIDKVPLPFQRVTIQDKFHPLHAFLKWKVWKTGQSSILYCVVNDFKCP